jgi:hypothetical protein
MKEELISFETAKLAKEKIFNIPVLSVYADNGCLSSDDTVYNFNQRAGYSAPTQSFLQKWLREKHRIDIYVKPSYCGYYCSFEYDLPEKSDSKILELETTYEEALEKGLFEALKLIKK